MRKIRTVALFIFFLFLTLYFPNKILAQSCPSNNYPISGFCQDWTGTQNFSGIEAAQYCGTAINCGYTVTVTCNGSCPNGVPTDHSCSGLCSPGVPAPTNTPGPTPTPGGPAYCPVGVCANNCLASQVRSTPPGACSSGEVCCELVHGDTCESEPGYACRDNSVCVGNRPGPNDLYDKHCCELIGASWPCSRSCCSLSCFLPGTKVKMEKGEKSIEEIKKGEKIMSYNPSTLKQTINTVKEPYTTTKKSYYVIKTASGREVKTTAEEPFYVGMGKQPEKSLIDKTKSLVNILYIYFLEGWNTLRITH